MRGDRGQKTSSEKQQTESNAVWQYYLPHESEEEYRWEDLYLMPCSVKWKRSLWLTVVAIGPNGFEDPARTEYYKKRMGGKGFHLFKKNLDMIVDAAFLTDKTLLEWAQKALLALGFRCDGLVRGTKEAFAGTNGHDLLIQVALAAAAEIEGEE